MDAIVNPNKKAPELFKSKFLNKLTWSNPVLIFVMYSIIAFVLIYFVAIQRYNYTVLESIMYFAIGFISWTLGEYLLHRFLYHKISDASYDKGLQYVFHGIHHSYPNDRTKVVLPPVPSLLIAGILFGLFYLAMGKLAFLVGPGFLIGYSIYMWIHYAVHKYPQPKRFSFWWTHHNIHHFQQHDRAFGVSTPLWDYVFRTMPEPNRKTINIIMGKETEEEKTEEKKEELPVEG